ncbi:MAG: hypothetical protein SV377_05655 [Halobacteria archaeon]|nr:hypothetical protein [Halobacteria archaeon]
MPESDDKKKRREVIVSERASKANTVFTTMISVILIFLGFAFIDFAIGLGFIYYVVSVFDFVLSLVGFRLVLPKPGSVSPLLQGVFSGIGIGLILLAGAIYVFSTRFKTKEELEHGG